MGLRGPNATPKRRGSRKPPPTIARHPWDVEGLSRAERVVAFIETLPCTAGTLAGTTLELRPWQKDFIDSVYATDEAGNRQIRTAVFSVARKHDVC